MKRRLLSIGICLLLGAVVNVAVAWGLAIALPLHVMKPIVVGARTIRAYHESQSTQFDGWELHWRSAPGSRTVAIVPEKASAPRDTAAAYNLPSEATLAYRRLCDLTDRPVNRPAGTWNLLVDQARGWPILALCCQYEYNSFSGRATTFIASGVKIQEGRTALGQATVLPLRPLWPGFAINTLFYATIVWLLIPGPFVLRRFLRVRRGLCPKCAYPMGESAVCTECGRALPSST